MIPLPKVKIAGNPELVELVDVPAWIKVWSPKIKNIWDRIDKHSGFIKMAKEWAKRQYTSENQTDPNNSPLPKVLRSFDRTNQADTVALMLLIHDADKCDNLLGLSDDPDERLRLAWVWNVQMLREAPDITLERVFQEQFDKFELLINSSVSKSVLQSPIAQFEYCIRTILYNSQTIERKCQQLSQSEHDLYDVENADNHEFIKEQLQEFFACNDQVDAVYSQLSEREKANMQGADAGWKHALDLAVNELESRYHFTRPIPGKRDDWEVSTILHRPLDKVFESAWETIQQSLKGIELSRKKAVKEQSNLDSLPTRPLPTITTTAANDADDALKRTESYWQTLIDRDKELVELAQGRYAATGIKVTELLRMIGVDGPNFVFDDSTSPPGVSIPLPNILERDIPLEIQPEWLDFRAAHLELMRVEQDQRLTIENRDYCLHPLKGSNSLANCRTELERLRECWKSMHDLPFFTEVIVQEVALLFDAVQRLVPTFRAVPQLCKTPQELIDRKLKEFLSDKRSKPSDYVGLYETYHADLDCVEAALNAVEQPANEVIERPLPTVDELAWHVNQWRRFVDALGTANSHHLRTWIGEYLTFRRRCPTTGDWIDIHQDHDRIGDIGQALLKQPDNDDRQLGYQFNGVAIMLGRFLINSPDKPLTDKELRDVLQNAIAVVKPLIVESPEESVAAKEAKGVSTKQSTVKGEAQEKLKAALLLWHKYETGNVGNYNPVGVNNLATLAEVGNGSASTFFKKQFKSGHSEYRIKCRDKAGLINALKTIAGDWTPRELQDQYDEFREAVANTSSSFND